MDVSSSNEYRWDAGTETFISVSTDGPPQDLKKLEREGRL
jgi:hypothetical protein